jgi:Ca2+-binding EF-hand superfamily protein
MKRINIDEFIKVITANKINLNVNEIQQLFHNYEVNNNSYFLYERMFDDLKSLYFNDSRSRFLNDFYNELVGVLGRQPKVIDLKYMFDHQNHPKFVKKMVTEEDLRYEFSEMADSFQFINVNFILTKNLNKNDSVLTKELFLEFFKFYGFGIESDEAFFDSVCATFIISKLTHGVSNREKERESSSKRGNVVQERPKTPEICVPKTPSTFVVEDNIYLEKLRKALKMFGKKSIFSLVKHFKFYDNGTKFINKYDFVKVLKDFRLNLTVSDMDKIFDSCCNDPKGMLINYEQFILALCEPLNEERKFFVKKAYDSLKQSTGSNKNVDIEVLKSFYNPRNHPIGKDEEETYAEFVECLDIFLYSYKMKKATNISYEEFEEFYRIVGFLIDDDEMFRNVVISEWKKSLSVEGSNGIEGRSKVKTPQPRNDNRDIPYDIRDNVKDRPTTENYLNKQSDKTNNQYSGGDRQFSAQQNNYRRGEGKKGDPLTMLRDRLRKRGVRGLMNLHKQFLLSCSNLGTINYGDFVKVLKLQKIDTIDSQFIFDSFKQQVGQYLNFPNFIRHFKKVLNENRLFYVENVFAKLDSQKIEMLNIEEVKYKFDALNHPDVVRGMKSEDDVITEFLDCFDLNYNFLVRRIDLPLGHL